MHVKQKQRGFTLIELIIVTMIMGSIAVVISKILVQSYQAFVSADNIADVEMQAFYLIDRFANDVHNIRSIADVTTMTATQFAFVDKNGNNVVYLLSGSSVLRNGQTLTNDVQNFALGYYSSGGVTTSTPSNLNYIWIVFTLTKGNMSLPYSLLFATRMIPS